MATVIATSIFVFKPQNSKVIFTNPIVPKSITKIFKKTIDPPEIETTLIAVGDISFSRGVESMIKKNQDYNYPLLQVKDYLQTGNLVFGNLETPITSGRHILDNEMIFRSDPETAQTIKNAGISIVSLANNHTPNFDQAGLLDTFKYLDEAGIKYVGAGQNLDLANQPVYLEANNLKFAFLAYNDNDVIPSNYEAGTNRAGTAFMHIDKMTETIKQIRPNVDFIIVSMHSGDEYQPTPNDSQIKFAHSAIDTGADLILGHHPHVVQTLEKYKNKYIVYSLGNFIFDQAWSQETKESLAVKIYFGQTEIEKIEFLPLIIENYCQPRPATAIEAEKIIQRLNFPLDNQKLLMSPLII